MCQSVRRYYRELVLNFAPPAKAIDRYIQLRSEEQSGTQDKIDLRLQAIIEGIFSRCIAEGEFKQVCPRRVSRFLVLSMILLGHRHRVGIAPPGYHRYNIQANE